MLLFFVNCLFFGNYAPFFRKLSFFWQLCSFFFVNYFFLLPAFHLRRPGVNPVLDMGEFHCDIGVTSRIYR